LSREHQAGYEKSDLFVFDKALPIGQSFPFDFGFLPSTVGDDGDPLDVLILAEQPTFTGCLIIAKLLGVIEAEQIENQERKRNDRFVAVPLEVKTEKIVAGSPHRLDPGIIENIAKFFVAYNQLQGRQFRVLRATGPGRGLTLIEEGTKKALRSKRK
jgi:inorganic pyrophosphatase